MHAALQQTQGTIAASPPPRRAAVQVAATDEVGARSLAAPSAAPSMIAPPIPTRSREFIIQGITKDGRTFRPSDWAERLASAMSCFRPAGASGGIGAFIGYSPYCVPTVVGNLKCVRVNEALRDIEPMAWDFVMNFARDNSLQLVEVCALRDAGPVQN
jgi:hypothetical protein